MTAKPKRLVKTAAAHRRDLFVEDYVSNGRNATKAAIKAGFAPKTAAFCGYRLLKEPAVAKRVAARFEKVLFSAGLSTERWAAEMAAIAHFDPGELYDADGALIPIKNLPEHVRRAIASIETEKRREGRGEDAETITTVKIRPCDKNTALANVGRHLGAFDEDNRQRLAPVQVNVVLRG